MNLPTCPKCGGHTFSFNVVQGVAVRFWAEGEDEIDHEVVDGPYGDMEWDDDVSAACTDCGYAAPLNKMEN